MNRKNLKKRKKLKRIIIAYSLRAIVILVPIIVIVLMVCGCRYIYEKITNKDDKRYVYADNDAPPIAPAKDDVPEFCVVIDAGHGGSDGGTVSGEAVEKDINLSVALKLKAILEDHNIEVILTRNADEDVSLAQRASVANDANADLFISLHCNYYEDDAQIAGLECYYDSPNAAESKAYAESIINAVSLRDDIKARNAKAVSYYVLRNVNIPAVLVEMGFLSNYTERQNLLSEDYQKNLSEIIAEGILEELADSEEIAQNE